MAISLPYLASNKNVPTLFEKISSAKVPDAFSQSFLQTTIGLKGKNDRNLIPLLRNLGFLDASNIPTSSYRILKGDNSKAAIAAGIRLAYSPLFDADQAAHKLPPEKLKSLVAQVAGTDDAATSRISSTFIALTKSADFEADLPASGKSKNPEEAVVEDDVGDDAEANPPKQDRNKFSPRNASGSLRPEFHYNIQVHLPSNASEEIYLNIFNALRKTFQ